MRRVVRLLGIWCIVAFSLSSALVSAGASSDAYTQTMLAINNEVPCETTVFQDLFLGTRLNSVRWLVFRGTPRVSGGNLTLAGAEIQSRRSVKYGCLEGKIRSSDWRAHDVFTDSSVGWELWSGGHGSCHSGIVFKGNGVLGVLRSEPDSRNACSGDPTYQSYLMIPSWDALRTDGAVLDFRLEWRPEAVMLTVSNGSISGAVTYAGPALPQSPLKIRLYTHTFDNNIAERYDFDYIRLAQ
jgi:hypothetical protein